MSRPRRVAELFDRCLDLPPAERAELLQRECGDDAALRDEVLELLAADSGEAAAALEQLTPPPPLELAPGTLVAGRYRIVRWLGAGGMGTVYEALQLQPQRRVALKCLRHGLGHGQALRRFQREAELLGRLRHPGIAQILEAGFVDAAGQQPFFAMEFVPGPTLLEHAAALPRRQQLLLFAEVCDAVQHAHALGIVHRDLKPANLLVDTAASPPRPKVLDFGVGRAVAGDTPDTLLTGTHEIVGTLSYLSPEQVAGGAAAVDARADVYSLGVTLYQLLAGRLPLELHGRPLAQAARLLHEQEPPRLDRLLPSLRGDVATIVHKALAKAPQRRYADAGELAADLRRHLHSQPIAARPASALYQLRRFAGRNRALVFGLATTFVALAAGLAVSLQFLAGERRQRALAERRAGDLQAIARELIFDVDEQLASVAGATAARRTVVATGLRYAEGLLRDAGDDPQLLTEVGLAFARLARVLGDPSQPNLGDLPAAEAALQQAIAALERAAASSPQPGTALDGLLGCHNTAAELHRAQNRPEQRLLALQAARDVAARLAALGDREGADLALAMAAANLGRVQMDAGRYAEAIPNLEAYVEAQKQRLGSGDPVAARNAALVLGFVAEARRRLGDAASCRQALDESLQIAETFHRQHADDARGRSAVVEALRRLAIDEAQQGRPAGALPLLERARALLQDLVPAQADVQELHLQLMVDFQLASALVDLQRPLEAQPRLSDYQQRAEALRQRSPQNRNRARDVMLGQQLAVRLCGLLGDEAGLQQSAGAALAGCRAAVAADGKAALAWDDLAKTQAAVSRAFEALRQAAPVAEQERLRPLLLASLENEAATLQRLGELGFGGGTAAERQRAVAGQLQSLRGEVGEAK